MPPHALSLFSRQDGQSKIIHVSHVDITCRNQWEDLFGICLGDWFEKWSGLPGKLMDSWGREQGCVVSHNG